MWSLKANDSIKRAKMNEDAAENEMIIHLFVNDAKIYVHMKVAQTVKHNAVRSVEHISNANGTRKLNFVIYSSLNRLNSGFQMHVHFGVRKVCVT